MTDRARTIFPGATLVRDNSKPADMRWEIIYRVRETDGSANVRWAFFSSQREALAQLADLPAEFDVSALGDLR